MLVPLSRDDAARLVVEAVRYAVGCSGIVVEAVCEAAEQMLRVLTVAEAEEIAAAIAQRAESAAFATRSDEDHWQRLRRQLLDRTLTGAPEQVPVIERDLALLCACAERQAEADEAPARQETQELVARTRRLLPPEEQTVLALLEA